MRITRNDEVLAAALALLLTAGTAVAASDTPDANTGTTATVATSSETDLNSRIPLPEPLNVPPPSAQDVAQPAPEKTAAPEKIESPAPQPAVTAAPPAETPAPISKPEVTSAPPAAATDTATAPAAAEPAIDPVSAKLKEIITSKLSRFVDRKEDRPGVESFYASRQYAPLFTDKGELNARGKATIDYLRNVSVDGLDPVDYPAPAFKAGADAQALAEAELKLVDSVVTFARHAAVGRVHFSRVSADVFYNQTAPDTGAVLGNVAKASDAGQALDSYLPQHPAYKALKAKLAEARGQKSEPEPAAAPAPAAPAVKIPEGSIMRQGDSDRRVVLLRKRLQIADQTSTKYDQEVADAVKDFQEKSGLDPDGSVGPMTLSALNGSAGTTPKPRSRNHVTDTIVANLERWRWVPHDLGKSHVVLNIANFTLKVFNKGDKIWETRVVVGKPNTPTPILTETMKYITVNPTWNVPPSIVYNEYLPALQQDPNAIARLGLKVVQNNDGSIHMYQPPGDGNALGRIRFNFPNKFLVYQHDTPDKHLFSRDTRAYSHGCMRVQDPLKYGEVILSIARPTERYTVDKLRSMYGPEEREITLPTPIPVHVTYQTAYVDDAGKLVIRDDIYGRDAQTLSVLRGDRQVADVAMDRRQEQVGNQQRPPVSLPYGVQTEGSSRYATRYEGGGGGNFFEMLFGGPRYYQQQPRPSTQADRRRTSGGPSRPLN